MIEKTWTVTAVLNGEMVEYNERSKSPGCGQTRCPMWGNSGPQLRWILLLCLYVHGADVKKIDIPEAVACATQMNVSAGTTVKGSTKITSR